MLFSHYFLLNENSFPKHLQVFFMSRITKTTMMTTTAKVKHPNLFKRQNENSNDKMTEAKN